MSEVINKPGEFIAATLEGFNKEGQRISELRYTTYGYDNSLANQAQFDLLKGIADVVAGWNEAKNK